MDFAARLAKKIEDRIKFLQSEKGETTINPNRRINIALPTALIETKDFLGNPKFHHALITTVRSIKVGDGGDKSNLILDNGLFNQRLGLSGFGLTNLGPVEDTAESVATTVGIALGNHGLNSIFTSENPYLVTICRKAGATKEDDNDYIKRKAQAIFRVLKSKGINTTRVKIFGVISRV